MDGFTGFKSAAGEELPQTRTVMDPFHVVSLAASKLDQCRRRIQRAITGRRGRAGDRLYRARRTLRTGAGLLTDAQAERLENLFADDRHAAVQASWGVYQRLIQAYRVEEPGLGRFPDATAHRLLEAGRPRRAGGDPDTGQDHDRKSCPHPWPTSTALDLQWPHRGDQRASGAPTRHRPGLAQPHQLHHPQPHPCRTPQRPPDNNHLNQTTNPTYHTLKHEEPLKRHESG